MARRPTVVTEEGEVIVVPSGDEDVFDEPVIDPRATPTARS